MVIILLAWILLFDINKLADKNSSDGYWQQVTHKIGNLWDSFKSDILKINNDVVIEDIVTQDEKIKELESQVFPQFEDPTRQ